MPKTKQNPSSTDRLRKTKHTSNMLKLKDTHIIGSPFDPVKLIADLIGYQRVLIKIKPGKSGGK